MSKVKEEQLKQIRRKLFTEGYKDFPKIIKDFDKLILKIVDGKEKLSDIRKFRDKLIKEVMK